MKLVSIMTVASALVLAACQTTPGEGSARATASLNPTAGNKTYGEVTFEQVGGKVRVVAQVARLTPSQEHGFHVHEVGDCGSADGTSAGGHFNPQGKPHGGPGSMARHAGDLPNLKANAKGRATLTVEVEGLTVTPGPASVVGRSVVVHAKPDDYRSQPSGDSGARVACGVIRAS